MLNKGIEKEKEDTCNTLTPIACKYCDHYTTYIIWDMELHLFETHDIRAAKTIKDVIDEGKRLGTKLDENSIQKLDLEYSKYLDKTSTDREAVSITAIYEDIMGGVRPWSQLIATTKNSFTFMPIIPVDEFFKDDHDKPYSALRSHSLEESPCYPIIDVKLAGRHLIYHCEICRPEFANDSVVANINLSSIEHHCRYKDPDRHRIEIVSRLEGWLR
ncbi:MAG: hypothetical protein WBZ36_24235 [Candidatus Nitrosopolaris sp.]